MKNIIDNMSKKILGKQDVIEKMVVALLVGGHVLIEDLPGVGKTTLAKSLSDSIDCKFSRIQFTPDLLPSDVLGVSIYNAKENDFEYKRGPIHANIVLADEINRTSPKTQSALLEAMEESQVTVDGKTYRLDEPFMVVATQNPIEYEGTFPLPEAQLDRFLMCISIGYPNVSNELDLLTQVENGSKNQPLESVVDSNYVMDARKKLDTVKVSKEVKEYIVQIVERTRTHPQLQLGGSPRCTLGLFKAARAYAYIKGRDFVTPEDVINVAQDVIAHRLILKSDAMYQGVTTKGVISNIISKLEIPEVDII